MLKDSGLFAQMAGQIKASFHSDYCAACAAGCGHDENIFLFRGHENVHHIGAGAGAVSGRCGRILGSSGQAGAARTFRPSGWRRKLIMKAS